MFLCFMLYCKQIELYFQVQLFRVISTYIHGAGWRPCYSNCDVYSSNIVLFIIGVFTYVKLYSIPF